MWVIALGFLVAASVLAVVIVLAVERYDTYLRLESAVCEEGIGNRQFFIIAVATPPWLLFTLASLGELRDQFEARRSGYTPRWGYFWFFLALASGLGTLILFELRC